MANETEWTPEQSAITVGGGTERPVSPMGLKRAKKQSDAGYHFTIPIDGETVFARELDDADLAHYDQTQNEIAAQNKANSLAANSQSKAAREQADAVAQELVTKQRDLIKWVLSHSVVGWDFGEEFSAEALFGYSKTVQLAIARAAVNSSRMGDQNSFLAPNS